MAMKSGFAALAAAAAFVLAAGAAQAQSLTGSWRGAAMGMFVQLTVQPGGRYIETQRSGAIMTQQSGEVRPAGPGLVAFTVEDWRPRTMPRYVPTGSSGGYWIQTPTTRPPGGVWRMRFNGPNSVTFTDARLGGSITYTRVG